MAQEVINLLPRSKRVGRHLPHFIRKLSAADSPLSEGRLIIRRARPVKFQDRFIRGGRISTLNPHAKPRPELLGFERSHVGKIRKR
jgi:hypothetical protein